MSQRLPDPAAAAGAAKRGARFGELTQTAANAPGITSSHGSVSVSGTSAPETSSAIAEQSVAGASTAYSSAPRASTRATAPSRSSPALRSAQ